MVTAFICENSLIYFCAHFILLKFCCLKYATQVNNLPHVECHSYFIAQILPLKFYCSNLLLKFYCSNFIAHILLLKFYCSNFTAQIALPKFYCLRFARHFYSFALGSILDYTCFGFILAIWIWGRYWWNFAAQIASKLGNLIVNTPSIKLTFLHLSI